eukprot:scaffold58943_cov31-Tisochrysis_lutea.AAC.2
MHRSECADSPSHTRRAASCLALPRARPERAAPRRARSTSGEGSRPPQRTPSDSNSRCARRRRAGRDRTSARGGCARGPLSPRHPTMTRLARCPRPFSRHRSPPRKPTRWTQQHVSLPLARHARRGSANHSSRRRGGVRGSVRWCA